MKNKQKCPIRKIVVSCVCNSLLKENLSKRQQQQQREASQIAVTTCCKMQESRKKIEDFLVSA